MTDVIHLLPDNIANQIAAGEVIQRPASAAKELMENAIDSGAGSIKLVLKDAGKTLIQVIDDGCGMSFTDARLSFERHATSKIKTASDLFQIHTMGFRGEALASIAAIAQVELRTRRRTDELGTRIVIEGFELKEHELEAVSAGTQFSVKNLFFNVPARRNFLKSNAVELRHIFDEFERIAIAHPNVFFSLHHNGQEIFHLPGSNLRQRLVGIFGKDTNKKLVPVSENTEALDINGFVGKPEFAKKTRGEQFFFVNNRFIKSGYLHHAVSTAFEDILPKDTFPFYVLFLEIDPAKIDVNVHPTKQEIKFEDERLVYNYLKAAVRHALGQNAVTPTLDFEVDTGLMHAISANSHQPLANDFLQSEADIANNNRQQPTTNSQQPTDWSSYQKQTGPNVNKSNLAHWQKLYEGIADIKLEEENSEGGQKTNNEDFSTREADFFSTRDAATPRETDIVPTFFTRSSSEKLPFQIHGIYIISVIPTGFLLIDQQAASERVWYERFLEKLVVNKPSTQTTLFPRTVRFGAAEAELLKVILPDINKLGFDVQVFGNDTFIVHGLPADWRGVTDELSALEELLEQYKSDISFSLNSRERLAASMSRSVAVKRGKILSIEEMQIIVEGLFNCAMPYKSPSGKKCFISYDLEMLNELF